MIDMNVYELAQLTTNVNVDAPGGIPTDLGSILTWVIRILFLFAGFIVAYNIIQGGLDWVQSGGEKEKVEKAQKKITASIIGLIILFATIAIVGLVESVFGVGLGLMKPIRFNSVCGVGVECFQENTQKQSCPAGYRPNPNTNPGQPKCIK